MEFPFLKIFLLICLLAFGVLLIVSVVMVVRRKNPDDALFKGLGVEARGPVPFVLVVVAAVGLWGLWNTYSPTLEKENERLEKAKKEIEQDLAAARAELKKDGAELENTKELLQQEKAERSQLGIESENLKNQLANAQEEVNKQRERTRAAWDTIQEHWMTDDEKKALNDLKQNVEAVNKDLPNEFRVVATPLGPRIDGRKSFVTFEVRRTAFERDSPPARGAGLFRFASTQYTIRIGYGKEEISEAQRIQIIQKICEQAASAAVNKAPLGEIIRALPGTLKATAANLDFDLEFLSDLAAFRYVVMRLQLMRVNPIVLVRGSADGEKAAWHQRLDRPYEIKLHNETTPKRDSADDGLTFEQGESSITIGEDGTYANKDLPDLRANWIWNNLKDVLDCQQATPDISVSSVRFWILEGREYSHLDQNDRKARVYLLMFLKED
jgi:hypothetical protein